MQNYKSIECSLQLPMYSFFRTYSDLVDIPLIFLGMLSFHLNFHQIQFLIRAPLPEGSNAFIIENVGIFPNKAEYPLHVHNLAIVYQTK
jgi:hypothetical protein